MKRFLPRSLGANFQALFRSGEAVYKEVSEGRQFNALYFSMLVFSCLIALLGLLLNSPAVIIGAMLISPLMGPILNCGLAMTMADGSLAKKAGRNLGLSIVETILIAAIATWLSPLKDATPEILARTNPNLMDLLVAFFSGAAGTLALCSQKTGLTIVPGVAIATAVMPPLATVGYGISTGQWNVASGAFMLFFTNLASIIVSADIVFLLVGVRPVRTPLGERANWLVRYRMAISFGILFLLSIPLIRTLTRAADQSRVRSEIRSILTQKLNHPGTRRLDEVRVQLERDSVSTEVVVQTATMILPEEEKRIEQALSQRMGRRVILHLDQVQLAQAAKPLAAATVVSRDYVAGGKIRPPSEEAKPSFGQTLEQIRRSAHDDLAPLLTATGVENFDVSAVAERDGTLTIALTGTYKTVSDLAAWKVICAAAAQKLGTPVRLSAAMYPPQDQTVWIRYRGKNPRLPASELRKARQALAQWSEQGLKYAFIAGADADDKLSQRRIDYLQSHLGEGLKIPDELAGRGGMPANAIGMAAVQLIDVSTTSATTALPAAK